MPWDLWNFKISVSTNHFEIQGIGLRFSNQLDQGSEIKKEWYAPINLVVSW